MKPGRKQITLGSVMVVIAILAVGLAYRELLFFWMIPCSMPFVVLGGLAWSCWFLLEASYRRRIARAGRRIARARPHPIDECEP